jgi:hypothetical protein
MVKSKNMIKIQITMKVIMVMYGDGDGDDVIDLSKGLSVNQG